MAELGDVYLGVIYYKGNSGEGKDRPFVIIDKEDDLYTIVEITSVEPKEPPGYYDRCKQFIVDWSIAGLDEESWAKCNKGNVHRIDETRLNRLLGSVTPEDFFSILNKIADVN